MSLGEGESEGDCGSLFDDMSVMVFFTRIREYFYVEYFYVEYFYVDFLPFVFLALDCRSLRGGWIGLRDRVSIRVVDLIRR